MNNVYYAVGGANAFGVYTILERIKNVKPYISDLSVVKSTTKEKAFCMARDIYNSFQEYGEVDDLYEGSSLDISLNRVYFKNEIRQLNREENSVHC